MTLRRSVAMIALFTLAGTGMARADWLDGAWSEESARTNGNPAVSISADTVHVVLPAASLRQAYEEGFTTAQALQEFLDRHGQRCSQLLDLNVPHPDLNVALSLQGPASFEDIPDGDAVLTALQHAGPGYQTDDGIALLFAVSPVKFEYRLNYTPTRHVRCVAPAADEATS
jgi:hypothetical protein